MRFLFDGLEVRAVDREGRPWFVGKDVCRVLGHKDVKQALNRLPPTERATVKVPDALGRDRDTTIISIGGVFRLAMTSRVDGADRFRAWVTDEVLPQLYTRGTYHEPTLAIPEADLSALVDQVAKLSDEVATLRAQVLPALALAHTPIAAALPAPKAATFGEWTLKPSKILSDMSPMYALADEPTILMSPAWFRRHLERDTDVTEALSEWVATMPPKPWA